MNERIRELYRQAHSVRHYDGDPVLDGNPPTVYWQGEVSAQRFAELIVKECADVLLKWKQEPFPFDEDLAVSLIKENFGIKNEIN